MGDRPVRLGGLLTGVGVTQIVNSAVHLAQPLLIADLSGSMGKAAAFTASGTALHMAGAYLGGWPTDRFGARKVLAVSTLLRGVVLAGIPIAMAAGFLSLVWVMVCWGAYAHAASGGGDRAMAASGSRRIMPPQWAQVRGAAVPVA